MSAPWLTLIGIGEDGWDGLGPLSRQALAEAGAIYGAKRHAALLEGKCGPVIPWPAPFSAGVEALMARRGQPTVVLATGDPMWFGVGATLARRLPAGEMTVLPGLSAFSLAAARLGWPLQETELLSLHGRPVDTLRAFLRPGARLLCLTSNAATAASVADLLADEGYGDSRMIALEHLGGPRERQVSARAEGWAEEITDFYVLAIEAEAVRDTPLRARVPGLPDDAFRHDGKITKREIRAATLARLAPVADAMLWDIGAGSGAIGIEWMRAARGARAIGLEPNAGRRATARANAAALGTPGLELLDATAPEGLAGLPSPDAVFLGGGLTAPGILDAVMESLRPGGRLVANAVTLESEAVLLAAYTHFGGDLCRLSIARAAPVGSLTGWRPLMPVTQWSLIKP
ncbi:precorrin-6y C5,15-methyltransferase (decarboxylating) subunit CbiE [Stappia taiwanensis]|uniref:Precorrin-6y C5,15-methyltransferase (Decarboxylating) subunit CbiE n=1 Tax=Stappia taiwanensis TaxID=992267 RepID=A0A838XQS0_9HYPH|nr:precorrin-6y C5,15-methyltransferase (decarboxylating) subunit CbiE [Stappia taiwanensis]MBA4612612.1 precorrin-6y C5,15-methyltransferase (decarboxylating) subunit CbiE [Stappia taiwanensis]GGE89064.1 precorrin-6Y methyltransferase [Stappia taiwanensis]